MSSTLRWDAAALLAAVLLSAGCTSVADKAGGTKPVHPVVLHVLNTRGSAEIKPFADKVREVSDGELRLDAVNNWELSSTTGEIDAIRAAQAGRADLAIVPARAWHSVGVTSFDALIAPLQIDSMALQQKVLASDVPAAMLTGLAPLGLRGIGILPGPMREPAGITRRLLGPSSYRAARIALNRSVVADRSLRALGATTVPFVFGGADVSPFDGIELQAAAVGGNRYDAVVGSITDNVHLWPRPLVVFGKAATLARLTRRQLGWLHSALHESLQATTAAIMNDDIEARGSMCRRGKLDFIAATPVQLEQLRAAFTPVYAWLRADPRTGHFLDAITALRSDVTAYPQEALSCDGVTRPNGAVPAPTPFDGTYTMVTTRRESLTSDPNVPPENWGAWVFVFDRGGFAITQENATACTWGYGTYSVTGARVAWTFLDGGGIAPSGAVNKPGEYFVFGWSRYHGLMQLTAVPGAVSPDNFFLRPWRVVSGASSASLLSSRCPPPATALPR